MIEGIRIKELKIIRDQRGQVMHMMRRDDGFFEKFGEIYFSVTNPGIIKAWKRHFRMTMHFAVPRGNLKLIIYDDRPTSLTQGQLQEISIGEDNYILVCIPPMLWYGFQCLGNTPAMITNCSDIPHDPKEQENIPIGDERIPYQWKINE